METIEQKFREAFLKFNKNARINKIQVNQFAATPTDGDFFIQTDKFDIVVECKQVTGFKPFSINRLTQETKLYEFSKAFDRNLSFVFIVFWNGRKSNSEAYLIHILDWIIVRHNWKKKSFNFDEFNEQFEHFKLDKDWKVQF